MLEFYQTRAGRQLIDATMPKIADELSRLNENLERLIATLEQSGHIEQKPEQP
jgi:hypothetical protein